MDCNYILSKNVRHFAYRQEITNYSQMVELKGYSEMPVRYLVFQLMLDQ